MSANSVARIGHIKPYTIPGPLVFREERYAAAFDAESPPATGKVIDAHTLGIEAEDIVDLFYKMYGNPRA